MDMILYKFFHIGGVKMNSLNKVFDEISETNKLTIKSFKITNNNQNCFLICGYEAKNLENKSSLSVTQGNDIQTEEYISQISKCPLIDINKIKDLNIKKLFDVKHMFNFNDFEHKEISLEFRECCKDMNLKSILTFYLKMKKNYSKLLDV